MRTALLALGMSVAAAAALADEVQIPATPPKTIVYLYGQADLARLQATNPNHYARAQPILAAANHLCRPGREEQVQFVKSDAKDASCATNLLRTSNPPQVQVTFTLDDTRYIALVMITDDPPRLVQVH